MEGSQARTVVHEYRAKISHEIYHEENGSFL